MAHKTHEVHRIVEIRALSAPADGWVAVFAVWKDGQPELDFCRVATWAAAVIVVETREVGSGSLVRSGCPREAVIGLVTAGDQTGLEPADSMSNFLGYAHRNDLAGLLQKKLRADALETLSTLAQAELEERWE